MIEWREKMSIDDGGVIDQDHKHLIEIVNHFEKLAADGLDKDEATEILYTLKFYTQTHFGREEQLQNLIDFPYREAHHHEHEGLVEALDGVIEHLKACREEVIDDVHAEISKLLHNWLVGHILHSDLKMRMYVNHMKVHTENLGALKDIEVSLD